VLQLSETPRGTFKASDDRVLFVISYTCQMWAFPVLQQRARTKGAHTAGKASAEMAKLLALAPQAPRFTLLPVPQQAPGQVRTCPATRALLIALQLIDCFCWPQPSVLRGAVPCHSATGLRRWRRCPAV
jgi:hypothetical protein